MKTYIEFEMLLKEKNITFEKEVMLKNLMPEPTKFKHKFKCDYVIDYPNKKHKLVVEIEGGTFTGGRHTRGVGFSNDILKYNSITLVGYSIIRFTAIMVKKHPSQVVELIEKYINGIVGTEYLSDFVERHKIKKKR